MSLLIKALNKAEEAQAQNAKNDVQAQNAKIELTQDVKSEESVDHIKSARVGAKQKPAIDVENTANTVLSLAPASKIIDKPALVEALLVDAGVVKTGATLSASPKNAANVFTAKGKVVGNGNKSLAIIAGFALLALLGMGAYFFQFIDNTPDMAMPARTIVAQPTAQPTAVSPQVVTIKADPAQISEDSTSAFAKSAKVQYETTAFEPKSFIEKRAQKQLGETQVTETLVSQTLASQALVTTQKKSNKKSANSSDSSTPDLSTPEFSDDETTANTDNIVEPEYIAEIDTAKHNQADAAIKANKKIGKFKTGQIGKTIASDSASITASSSNSGGVSVSKNKSQTQVSPTLMRAYEAYNVGNDTEAQKLYKQVLQRDVRSVDALLGLGAIAQRQGRLADANGWYGKVLEVEPRNNIAQTAMLDNKLQDNQQLGNGPSNESRIKNLLARQPDDANLHASLGNYYAEQNQWSAAQQAYFDAYRLYASADNALNLAVSLDQMGKPKLALPYYQRALSLAQTDANGIDKATIEARIAAIQ